MNFITRLIASMTALITGLVLLITSAFQGGTGMGFENKETLDLTSGRTHLWRQHQVRTPQAGGGFPWRAVCCV